MSAQEHPIEMVIEYARKSGMPTLAKAAERDLEELRQNAKGYLNSAITAGDNLVDLGRRNLALMAERDELKRVLKSIEHTPNGDWVECPVCETLATEGHKPNCALAAALKDTE